MTHTRIRTRAQKGFYVCTTTITTPPHRDQALMQPLAFAPWHGSGVLHAAYVSPLHPPCSNEESFANNVNTMLFGQARQRGTRPP